MPPELCIPAFIAQLFSVQAPCLDITPECELLAVGGALRTMQHLMQRQAAHLRDRGEAPALEGAIGADHFAALVEKANKLRQRIRRKLPLALHLFQHDGSRNSRRRDLGACGTDLLSLHVPPWVPLHANVA